MATAARSPRIPRTKATNAYDLLKEVRDLILEDPRRYNQRTTLNHYPPGVQWTEGPRRQPILAPPCGTVGCRAGWVVELTRSRTQYVVRGAQDILGLTDAQAETFFAAAAAAGWAGTPEHARSGAYGITAFLKKHAKQLKAKRIGGRKQ
jgi:hypothetical protein